MNKAQRKPLQLSLLLQHPQDRFEQFVHMTQQLFDDLQVHHKIMHEGILD